MTCAPAAARASAIGYPLTISVAAAIGLLFTALISVRWRLLAPGLRL